MPARYSRKLKLAPDILKSAETVELKTRGMIPPKLSLME